MQIRSIPEIRKPTCPTASRTRVFDRDLIRGWHDGQRSFAPSKQAEHMGATDQMCRRAKSPCQLRCRSLIAAGESKRKPVGALHPFAPKSFLLFDRAAAFLSPRPRVHRPSRADAVKTGRLSAATTRLGLDSGEHGGTLEMSGCCVVRARQCYFPGSWFSTRSAMYRRNIRSEAQALQCPQRAHA